MAAASAVEHMAEQEKDVRTRSFRSVSPVVIPGRTVLRFVRMYLGSIHVDGRSGIGKKRQRAEIEGRQMLSSRQRLEFDRNEAESCLTREGAPSSRSSLSDLVNHAIEERSPSLR